MNISRSLKMGVAATFLWLSTSGSSFAATSLISNKNESITPEIPTNLISQMDLRRIAGQIGGYGALSKFDEIWKSKTDVQKRMFEYCNTQKDIETKLCFNVLQLWSADQMMNNDDLEGKDYDLLNSIDDELFKMRKAQSGQ